MVGLMSAGQPEKRDCVFSPETQRVDCRSKGQSFPFRGPVCTGKEKAQEEECRSWKPGCTGRVSRVCSEPGGACPSVPQSLLCWGLCMCLGVFQAARLHFLLTFMNR